MIDRTTTDDQREIRDQANASLRERLQGRSGQAAHRAATRTDHQGGASTTDQDTPPAHRQASIERTLEAAGAINGRHVHALIKDGLELGDDGQPINLDPLLNELRRTDPDMFSASGGSGDGGSGLGRSNVPGGQGDPNQRLKDQLRGYRAK